LLAKGATFHSYSLRHKLPDPNYQEDSDEDETFRRSAAIDHGPFSLSFEYSLAYTNWDDGFNKKG